ncbi:uncharacterized protein LOC112572644 isoform X2 [Pomacea canaliculata]|nr:uncharacterized protein LOC112572644 isoform X2 [Pomacea canaliculata]
MYESLPRNKQKIFKQNSAPSLWTPSTTVDRDFSRWRGFCDKNVEPRSSGGAHDGNNSPSSLDRKSQKSQKKKNHPGSASNIQWSFLDNRSSPRHREPIWDAFKNVEKKIPPKLREESLEAVGNDFPSDVKPVSADSDISLADCDARSATIGETLDTANDADTISVLSEYGETEPSGDNPLPYNRDSFRRTRITASSSLDHVLHFVMEDPSGTRPAQGLHPGLTCCFRHFCAYFLPHQSLRGQTEKIDYASAKLLKKLFALEKVGVLTLKNGTKTSLDHSGSDSLFSRLHFSSEDLRLLFPSSWDLRKCVCTTTSDACHAHDSDLQCHFHHDVCSESFSNKKIDIEQGRNGFPREKGLSKSRLQSSTHLPTELSHLPNSALVTDGKKQKDLNGNDSTPEGKKENRPEARRFGCDYSDHLHVPIPASFLDVSCHKDTTECLHHSYVNETEEYVKLADKNQRETGTKHTSTCNIHLQETSGAHRTKVAYFQDSISESDDDSILQTTTDMSKRVAARTDVEDFLDNNNYLEGVDMCTSPGCERCREMETVQAFPGTCGSRNGEPKRDQRKMPLTVTLTEVCQETCIFHNQALFQSLVDSSKRTDELSSLDGSGDMMTASLLAGKQQLRDSPFSPGEFSSNTAPTHNASVVLRADDLNAPAYLQRYLEEAQSQYLANKGTSDVAHISGSGNFPSGDASLHVDDDLLDENFIREQIAAVDAACEDAMRRQASCNSGGSSSKKMKKSKKDKNRSKEKKSSKADSGSATGSKKNKSIRASIEDIDAEEDEGGAWPGSCDSRVNPGGLSIVQVGGITTDDPAFEMIVSDDSYEEIPYATRRRQRLRESGLDGWKDETPSSLRNRIIKAALCTFLILFVIGLIIGLAIHFTGSSAKTIDSESSALANVNGYPAGGFPLQRAIRR